MKIPSRQTVLWLAALLIAAWGLRAPFLAREFWGLDEGSTFTMAEQVRHGAVLYRDAVDNRSPLMPYAKALVFLVAGDWNIRAQHIVLALLMGANAFAILALARTLGRELLGCVSAVAFTAFVFLLPGEIDSLGEHTESFVVLFSTLGFLLFARSVRQGRFLAGVGVGLAFAASSLCKQPGLLDFAVTWPIFGLLAWRLPEERPRLVRVFVGALSAFAGAWALTCLYFWLNHAWHDFVYYAWTFNSRLYVPEIPFFRRLATMRLTWDLALAWVPVALVLSVPGVVLALRENARWFREPLSSPPDEPTAARKCHRYATFEQRFGGAVLALLALGWLVSGIVSTGLSGRAFPHYAIQVVPGLALLSGLTIEALLVAVRQPTHARGRAWRVGGYVMVALLGLWVVSNIRSLWRRLDPNDDPANRVLRAIVQRHTNPKDRILVWGYYPEGYAVTRRLPATRFIYTNYLTGLIPWTNLAPEIDTRYAVETGAWDAFWRDYLRTPPQVILDSPIRGYVKYPLLAQPRLRDDVINNFAEIRPSHGEQLPIRVLRRMAPPDRNLATAASGAPQDERVQLSIRREPDQSDLVLAVVTAPAGTTDLLLRVGGEAYRHLRCLPDSPIDARFFVRLDDLVVHGMKLDAVAQCDGVLMSTRSLDVARQLVMDIRPIELTPVLDYGTQRLQPIGGADPKEWQRERREDIAGWKHHSAFTLSFERPPQMQVFQFDWLAPETDEKDVSPSSARGLEVEFNSKLVAPEKLPLTVSVGPSGLRRVSVELPRADPGVINLRSYPPGFVWVGNLHGFAHGPVAQFGARGVRPEQAIQNDYERLTSNTDQSWDVRAFGRVIYPRVPGMECMVVEYSVPESAYQSGKGEPPKVILEINYVHDDGRTENLLTRGLSPADNPGDRGLQLSNFTLPEQGTGEIELRVVPLSRGNPNNVLTFHRIRAQGAGPDLVLDRDRVLVPLESVSGGSDRIRLKSSRGWIAHSPARVTYACPADLRAITIGFGLEPESYWDDHHAPRTDGIDVLVELVEPNGAVTELYKRSLDPFHLEADRGTQQTRIVLPGRAGRLTIRLTPGRYASPAFDWGYLTNFSGEIAP